MADLINHSQLINCKLLHAFTREHSAYQSQVWKRPDGGYTVVCVSAQHDFSKGFVNGEHAIDYALEWIRP